ncbi:acetyl-CoA synthetase-like protein [Teratosphaeria nubilosa]|uniref:Acetyl-CoA synthetase-like protein n=1 Tax=Teratosphaeria nubilosa TaxID=161662 RepID=A0A6G1KSU1_9PEZI|nr:acetyl-CoA synthetase-like protein [Teratosphaeria nubilosa]
MPFLATEHYPVPNKDINSWTFDDYKHDWDAPIYIDALNPEGNHITARRARLLIRQLAAGFKALGLQRGECVCIHSFNDTHYPIFFLGVIAAGGVFAGTNPAYTPHELAHTMRTAKIKFVLTQPELLGPTLKGTQEADISRDRVIIFNPNGAKAPEGFLQWKDLLSRGETDWLRFDDFQTATRTEAARLFSSGTTGLPKAASLSHRNLVAQHTLVFEAVPRPWKASRLMALPMFHAATAPSAFCTPLRAGEPAYVMKRFEPEKWFWATDKYQITDIGLVPPIAIMVMNSPLNKKYSLKSARQVSCGAAPLDKGPQARVQALLNDDCPLVQVWGMTETSCIATRFPYPEKDTTGSVGRALPDIDLKLVDENGRDMSGYDLRGELCVRGPTVVMGYFENPEANARDWDSEGYFHTGDIAYCDGKTKLWYIVDRKKELIKVRGFQVAPPELEGTLLGYPGIIDAAVIGVPDPVTESEIHEFMKERLASYKRLEGGVVFVDAIPKNASGKILKRMLREQAKKEMGAKM